MRNLHHKNLISSNILIKNVQCNFMCEYGGYESLTWRQLDWTVYTVFCWCFKYYTLYSIFISLELLIFGHLHHMHYTTYTICFNYPYYFMSLWLAIMFFIVVIYAVFIFT